MMMTGGKVQTLRPGARSPERMSLAAAINEVSKTARAVADAKASIGRAHRMVSRPKRARRAPRLGSPLLVTRSQGV
jgi:hypothetical protein